MRKAQGNFFMDELWPDTLGTKSQSLLTRCCGSFEDDAKFRSRWASTKHGAVWLGDIGKVATAAPLIRRAGATVPVQPLVPV